jgi:glycosyltransferase involved in cell wall biosynthesis
MVKVSIIVPVYNAEKYLKKCLDSIVNQTLKDIEIICIDDGSTDNSLVIINDYAQRDFRVKVLHQENAKQGAARNRGMKIACGEYIGFIDSDDWIDLDYFEKLYNTAKKYDSDIALATNVRIGGRKRTKKRLQIVEEKYVTELQEKFDITYVCKNPCPTNKIYRRSMLECNSIVWAEGCYCEDKLFVTQAVYFANGVVAVPSINYYYFRNPNSTVNSIQTNKHKLDKNNANLDVLEFLKNKHANVRDKDFWAITKYYPNKDFVLLAKKESLKTFKYLLFGVIKILEKG